MAEMQARLHRLPADGFPAPEGEFLPRQFRDMREMIEEFALDGLRPGVDWLEAGTPLILAEGLHGVRALRERFPDRPLASVAGGDLTSALLKRVSRSFYISLAVLPSAIRPTIGLAYLLARAADTIADTRLIERRARITHLEALRAEMTGPEPQRLAGIIAAAGFRSLPAERQLL